MNKHALALLASVAFTAPAVAATLPAPSPATPDPNIKTAEYVPNLRTPLIGVMKRSTVISVCPRETIVHVVFGDEEIWGGPDTKAQQTQQLGNALPLWPAKPGKTNLQIITAEPGKPEKVYQFATEVRPEPADGVDDSKAVYGLTFKCSAEANAAASEAARQRWLAQKHQAEDMAQAAAARTQIDRDTLDNCTNWAYIGRGSRVIEPKICDTGQVTLLQFPGQMRMPAVFRVLEDKTEQPVPWVPKEHTMVVQLTAYHFRIRASGDNVLDIWNRNYSPIGFDPGTGTTSPNVVRALRTAGQ